MTTELKKLESLVDYRDRKTKQWQKRNQSGLDTGIECPNCEGVEMKSYGAILSTLPPSEKVQCPRCGVSASVPV